MLKTLRSAPCVLSLMSQRWAQWHGRPVAIRPLRAARPEASSPPAGERRLRMTGVLSREVSAGNDPRKNKRVAKVNGAHATRHDGTSAKPITRTKEEQP